MAESRRLSSKIDVKVQNGAWKLLMEGSFPVLISCRYLKNPSNTLRH